MPFTPGQQTGLLQIRTVLVGYLVFYPSGFLPIPLLQVYDFWYNMMPVILYIDAL